MGNQYTAQQFIDAIPGTGGIITAIAKKIGCTWHTAQRYITDYPTIQRAWQDERETILDMSEMALFGQVKNGESWAVKYVLSTLGKSRGYTERTEVTGADGGPLTVHVVYDGTDGADNAD